MKAKIPCHKFSKFASNLSGQDLEQWKQGICKGLAEVSQWFDLVPNGMEVSQMPPKIPKSPFTIPLVPTTHVTPMTEDEDMFYDCL
jgi:hypothetical protein